MLQRLYADSRSQGPMPVFAHRPPPVLTESA